MSNKYTYSPPFTEEQLHEAYVNLGMSQAEVADLYHTSQHVVQRAMRKMNIPARGCVKRDQRGPKNHMWKGGRVLSGVTIPRGRRYLSEACKKGYWLIQLPEHPHANKRGYVFEHIVNALKAAGRERLAEDECVHHIDFDKRSTEPDNLMICSKDKHREYHAKLEGLVQQLLREGVVVFDKEKGYVRAL